MATTSMAPRSGRPAFQTSSLYVGDLLPEVGESILFTMFNNIGPVASCRICRDQHRNSRGYAFITFHTPADAGRALEALNFTLIKGKPCRIMWSQPDKSLRTSGKGNVVVRGLHTSIDDKTLWDSFSVFGTILSCKVVRNKKGESRGYGYVHFEKESSADKAIEGVQGVLFSDRKVTAEAFIPRHRQATAVIKDLPPTTTNDSLLTAILKSCAINPLSIKIVKNWETGELAGYAYVNFIATKAVAMLVEKDNILIDGAKTHVEKFLTLEELQKQETKPFVNLYVRGLPDDFKEEALNTLFKDKVQTRIDEDYDKAEAEWNRGGCVGDMPLKHNPDIVRSRVWSTEEFTYACVEFGLHQHAKMAIELLNKTQISDGSYLYVSRARSRAQRKLLAAQNASRNNTQGANLYVKHLLPGVASEQLKAMFAPFGDIVNARVMEKDDGSSRCFGFVQFRKQDDAKRAMNEMRNQTVDGSGPLYVSVAQKRSDRERKLNASWKRGGGRPQMYARRPHPRDAVAGQFGPRPAPPATAFGMPAPYYQPRTAPQMPPMMQQMAGFGRYPAPMVQQPSAGMPMMTRPPNFPVPPPHFQPPSAGMPMMTRPAPTSVPGTGSQGISGAPAAAGSASRGLGSGPQRSSAPGGGSVPPYSAAMRESQPALTSDLLDMSKPPERKRMIGERLFPKIQEVEPRLAGKITGMLLEMDNAELLSLLENSSHLLKKINEALAVLKEHQMRQSQKNSGKNLSGTNPGSTKNPGRTGSVGTAGSAGQ